MKALRGSLLLSFILVAQLAFFAPATQAATRHPKHPTSQCTGTLTLTGKLGTTHESTQLRADWGIQRSFWFSL